MFYKPSKSPRSKLLKTCDYLFRQIIILERGNLCQFGPHSNPDVFHILPKSSHPRLRFCKKNVLLVCRGEHFLWHSDYFQAKKIEERIKKVLGDNYKEELLILERTMSKVDLKMLQLVLTQELKELNEKRAGKQD